MRCYPKGERSANFSAFVTLESDHPVGPPREALRSRPRRRPRPGIRPRGVMEYWSVGVLRQLGIAPRVREVGPPFRAIRGGQFTQG
jgi:hypothetical protein